MKTLSNSLRLSPSRKLGSFVSRRSGGTIHIPRAGIACGFAKLMRLFLEGLTTGEGEVVRIVVTA
jgi:hypothetical protein